MPFDFAMYLIKADECGGDEVTKPSAADVNNNKKNERTMTSQAITCVPGRTRSLPHRYGSQCPVNVFSFSKAHVFNEDLASLRRDLQCLKQELNGEDHLQSSRNVPKQNGRHKVVCKMEESTQNGMKCYNGVIKMGTDNTDDDSVFESDNSNENSNSNNNSCRIVASMILNRKKPAGGFTAMLNDFSNTLESHDDATCQASHCHLCKGPPKRALSMDSAKMRPRIRRKVTFADDNGMPLSKIRVMPCSDNPRAPNMQSLDIYGIHGRYKQLRLDFPQPAADFSSFLERLRRQNVSLENVKTDGTSFLGTVRVKNLAMEKDVCMRFTTDNWQTWTDIVASYVYEDTTSCYDLFGFHVSVGHLPNEVEFAICYRVRDEEHWDNNDGRNYRLQMVSH